MESRREVVWEMELSHFLLQKNHHSLKNMESWEFPGVPVVGTQGTQVQCLVEEIRSQKPYGIGKKFKKKFYIKYIESLAF